MVFSSEIHSYPTCYSDISWVVTLPSNSHQQDYYIFSTFSRESYKPSFATDSGRGWKRRHDTRLTQSRAGLDLRLQAFSKKAIHALTTSQCQLGHNIKYGAKLVWMDYGCGEKPPKTHTQTHFDPT